MRVFLCHSNKDKKVIRRLAKDLEAQGIEVWLDEYKIRVGDTIVEKLQEGISHCDFLLVWLTKKAVRSKWVQREWYTKYHEEIENGRVMVLPLLAQDCDLPTFLRPKRFADFRKDYQAGLSELLEVFRRQPVHNAKIEFDTIDPVYWSVFGCPITIYVSCESVSGNNKVIVLQRGATEPDNIWHFQFERRLDQVNQAMSGKVWYGTRKKGNLQYQEVLAGIVPKERKYKGHPFYVVLDYDDLLKFKTRTVYRDDRVGRKHEQKIEPSG